MIANIRSNDIDIDEKLKLYSLFTNFDNSNANGMKSIASHMPTAITRVKADTNSQILFLEEGQ
jgi:hypothetical protein